MAEHLNLLVREATSDDAQLIADLTRAAWAGRVAATSSGHRETAVTVREHMVEGGGFILYLDDVAIGSTRWMPLDAASDTWEIMRMGVIAAHGGDNLSEHLLEAVIHAALAANVEELRLAVRCDQLRLVDLYSTYGFEVAPELEYTHANPLDLPPIVMRRMLG